MNNYIRLPKDIIENKIKLPEKAVRLYAMMLDRYSLSEKNNWNDKKGTYIIFSQSEIQKRLSVKKRRASSLLAALKEAHLITCRKQPGRPDRIYLTAKSVSNISYQDNSVNNQNHNTQDFYDFYVSFFENMAYQDADCERKETVQETVSALNMPESTKCINGRKTVLSEQKQERKTCAKKVHHRRCKKVHHSNNINIKTKSNISNQSKKNDAIKSAHENCKTEFAKQIDYDALAYDEPENRYLPLIVDVAADALSNQKDLIRCAGSDRLSRDVRQRLKSLNFMHVKYILECVKGTSAPIRNPKAYILACLFNAPLTMSAYYEQQAKYALSSKVAAYNQDTDTSMSEWDEFFIKQLNSRNIISK